MLTDYVINILERHRLETLILIRLWRHTATTIFQDVPRYIDDIPHHGTPGGEGSGTTTDQHIAANHIAANGDRIVHPIHMRQPTICRHQGRVHTHIQPSVSHLRQGQQLDAIAEFLGIGNIELTQSYDAFRVDRLVRDPRTERERGQ